MRSDIGEIKVDLRALRDKVDGVDKAVHSAKIWGMTLHITTMGAMLAVMARGFGWL
jgi:hypothetical protein